ncbi:hypothetical protein Hypma_006379 [Hypsizygus marmoreus]|uniref:Protein kinase domain-containing protein n=1 Tax=Hypsizygus marmoreus TaxID=39966 RepID=A0A369JTR6_HYPMA|nr:hypothetical protein Hypma_006379 [Hypsizygus marmoreus]
MATTPAKSSTEPDEECPIGSKTALLAFSSMTIHGLASCEGKPIPFVFHRSTSFPSRRFTAAGRMACDDMEGWDSMSLPVGKPHLELELGKCLGDGRIGFAYVARVVAVLDRPGGAPVSNPPLELSTELVLKFVRPTNCRSLARESWFYERLPEAEGFQGAVVPLCYGFFTASTISLPGAPLDIKPWIDKNGEHVPVDFPEGQREYGDELPDEYPFNQYRDDGRTCRTESPWCEWRPDPKHPLLGVLALEKLGETYSHETFETDPKSRRVHPSSPFPHAPSDTRFISRRKDLVDLIDDLSAATIKHRDFKFNNVVRALTNVVCPRHGHAHQWRVIDFDLSERWSKKMTLDNDYFPQLIRYQYTQYNYEDFPVMFWTSLP